MTMEYIMTIGIIIYIEGKGYVIGGTVAGDRSSKGFYIGKENDGILVESDDISYSFIIKGVKISSSFLGNWTIGILVYDSEDIHSIKVGDKVHAIVGK